MINIGIPNKKRIPDKHLITALTKAYMARAQLFHEGVKASNIDLLIAEIDDIDAKSIDWSKKNLGVSKESLKRVIKAGGYPHQVFAHPQIIIKRPHLIGYYRNIVTISKKGIGQILFSTERYESGGKKISAEDAAIICETLNQILSGVIETLPNYTIELSRQAILAEIGTELQGTWANVIGRGAANAVKELLREYIEKEKLGLYLKDGSFKLNNNWNIIFGNEPDVAFFDNKGVKQIAIEIKGSLDKAGAQTRYGEAKKSFGKQLSENPRCHTVYLASCFTDAVIEQIKQDGQVREWFNLTSILYDEPERKRFLNRLFHIVKTPI
ncbi:MAG: XcyI family restriction endonuclease [Sedimentisphaerales bacterium]|nr:XcyI family restriction endonuclease [Sedimentisphaerales bacterium]